MKKTLLILASFLFFFSGLFAQGGFFQSLARKNAKYFVSAGYGVGTARWFSDLDNSNLYDATGAIIKSGTLKFRAKNSTSMYDLNVMCPVGRIRLGLGINFEEFYLDKLEVEAFNVQRIVIFDETFRFDKFYAQAEYQFFIESKSPFSISANTHLGYFGYTGVTRINFFGEEALAKTWFMTLGAVGDFRVFSHSYLYIHPQFEYKYFNNSPVERPQKISHKILSFSFAFGIRVDVSRER